ncbi:MAG TPA: methylaspartate mutase subunit E [Dehalococcoidia bacterium]|nr:methylaspartate mutase subunit E [Dehalococcoidia bacterium]
MELSSRRWDEEQLLEVRKEVLAQWPTGREVDLDEAVEYQKSLPQEKVWARKLTQGYQQGTVFTMPQVGRATVEETATHMKYVEEEAGADAWLIFMDTYTRKGRFKDAQQGIDESIRQGRSMLNGYPAVCHGVKGLRRIREVSQVPFYITNVDEDPRLATEIGFAGGATGYLSYDLHDLLQHSKNYPLDMRIQNNQYGNRLISYYEERGAPIVAWSSGHFNGWEPPGLKIPIVILTALLTAEQGVKHIGLTLGLCVHLVQDVAALRVLHELTKEYLARFGYSDVAVYLWTYPFLGVWPRDVDRTAALIAWQAAISVLSGVGCMIVKSLDEAYVVPEKEGNAHAVKMAKQIIDVVGKQRLGESQELKLEQEMLRREVRASLDKTIELGEGDVAIGMMRAVERGVLDGVFSPWLRCHNKVLPVRDATGAIRYLDYGNVPLPPEVVEYNNQKIAEREKLEGVKADIEMVIQDISFLSRALF